MSLNQDVHEGEKRANQQYKPPSSLKELQAGSSLLHYTSSVSFSHQLCHTAQSQSAADPSTVISITNATFIPLLIECNYLPHQYIQSNPPHISGVSIGWVMSPPKKKKSIH